MGFRTFLFPLRPHRNETPFFLGTKFAVDPRRVDTYTLSGRFSSRNLRVGVAFRLGRTGIGRQSSRDWRALTRSRRGRLPDLHNSASPRTTELPQLGPPVPGSAPKRSSSPCDDAHRQATTIVAPTRAPCGLKGPQPLCSATAKKRRQHPFQHLFHETDPTI